MNRRQAIKAAVSTIAMAIAGGTIVKTTEPIFVSPQAPTCPKPPPHRTLEQLWEEHKKLEVKQLDDITDNKYLSTWQRVETYPVSFYNRIKARMIARGINPVIQILDGRECIIHRGSIFTTDIYN